jgi:hypothetical protein
MLKPEWVMKFHMSDEDVVKAATGASATPPGNTPAAPASGTRAPLGSFFGGAPAPKTPVENPATPRPMTPAEQQFMQQPGAM